MIPIQAATSQVSFKIKVHPRARKNAITGIVGDALKISLTSPPLEGRANQAVVEFFAEMFHVPRSAVTIAAGSSNRNKIIRIANCMKADVLSVLQINLPDYKK